MLKSTSNSDNINVINTKESEVCMMIVKRMNDATEYSMKTSVSVL